jgi:hypothetical protein
LAVFEDDEALKFRSVVEDFTGTPSDEQILEDFNKTVCEYIGVGM